MHHCPQLSLRSRISKTAGAFALALVLFASIPTAQAQTPTKAGVHLGFDLDWGSLLLGANAIVELPTLPITGNPTLDYFLNDSWTIIQLNANGLYPLPLERFEFDTYAGAGLGLRYMSFDSSASPDLDTSDSDLVLNLIGGASFEMGTLEPFAEARLSVGSGSTLALIGGVRVDI